MDGCDKPCHAKGMCNSHYERVRRTGGIELSRAPNGSGSVEDGYVRV